MNAYEAMSARIEMEPFLYVFYGTLESLVVHEFVCAGRMLTCSHHIVMRPLYGLIDLD